MNIDELTRDEKLLVQAALDVQTEESTGSGHNTAWAEVVDLVLSGRKGLFDYDDSELDETLSQNAELLSMSKQEVLLWARRTSNIQSVSSETRTWEVVPEEQQIAWQKEDEAQLKVDRGNEEGTLKYFNERNPI